MQRVILSFDTVQLLFFAIILAYPLARLDGSTDGGFIGETKIGVAMATISNTLAVITISLMYYVFIELL